MPAPLAAPDAAARVLAEMHAVGDTELEVERETVLDAPGDVDGVELGVADPHTDALRDGESEAESDGVDDDVVETDIE